MPRIKGVAHVELGVSELDVSAAWYSALLGASGSFTPRRVGLDHLAFGVADEAELGA